MKISRFLLKTAAALISPMVYVEKGVNRVKENVKEDLEDIVVRVIRLIFIFFVGFMFLFFVSITCAVMLNEQLQSSYLGYFVVGGFYLLVLSLILLLQYLDVDIFRSQAKKILHTEEN